MDNAARQPLDRPVCDDDRDEKRGERADGFGARFGHARRRHQDRPSDREARGNPHERIGCSLGLRQVDRETLALFRERAVPFELEIGGVRSLDEADGGQNVGEPHGDRVTDADLLLRQRANAAAHLDEGEPDQRQRRERQDAELPVEDEHDPGQPQEQHQILRHHEAEGGHRRHDPTGFAVTEIQHEAGVHAGGRAQVRAKIAAEQVALQPDQYRLADPLRDAHRLKRGESAERTKNYDRGHEAENQPGTAAFDDRGERRLHQPDEQRGRRPRKPREEERRRQSATMRADIVPLQPQESLDHLTIDQPGEPSPKGAPRIGGADSLRLGLGTPS